jgi:hypothetical protein
MPTILPDPREIRSLRYPQLHQRFPRYGQALLLLAACRVVPTDCLVTFAGAGIKTKQGQGYFRRQLVAYGFAQQVEDFPYLFKLGRPGCQLLAQAGIEAHFRDDPAERTTPGLALAGEFAANVLAELPSSGRILAATWREPAFSGAGLRPDGECSLLWRCAGRDTINTGALLQPGWTPPTETAPGLLLSLEVDRGTQYRRQLDKKLERWSARLENEPPGQTVIFWLTAGGQDRGANLRSLWCRYVPPAYPALFGSVQQLRNETGQLCPLRATWQTAQGTPTTGWEAVIRRDQTRPRAPWEW